MEFIDEYTVTKLGVYCIMISMNAYPLKCDSNLIRKLKIFVENMIQQLAVRQDAPGQL